jgi:hypothetical protein
VNPQAIPQEVADVTVTRKRRGDFVIMAFQYRLFTA